MKLSKIHLMLKFGCLSMLSIIALAGCTTTPTSSAFERQRYLESFIGKSSETIQSQLNLSQLGYQNISPGLLTPRSPNLSCRASDQHSTPHGRQPCSRARERFSRTDSERLKWL